MSYEDNENEGVMALAHKIEHLLEQMIQSHNLEQLSDSHIWTQCHQFMDRIVHQLAHLEDTHNAHAPQGEGTHDMTYDFSAEEQHEEETEREYGEEGEGEHHHGGNDGYYEGGDDDAQYENYDEGE